MLRQYLPITTPALEIFSEQAFFCFGKKFDFHIKLIVASQMEENRELKLLKKTNEQLLEENEMLREQLRELQYKKTGKKFGRWFARAVSTMYFGRGLKKSFLKLW